MISTSCRPPRWTLPGRHLLVAFGPGQPSQQSTTSINHQHSHILTFQKQILRDLCLKVYKDHEAYEQNPLLRRLSLCQIFLGANLSDSEIQKFTASVLERKRMERWSLGLNCKSEQSRTSCKVLTGIEFFKIIERSSGWKIFDRLAHKVYEFIDVKLMHY